MIFHLQKECGEIQIKNYTKKLFFFSPAAELFGRKFLPGVGSTD
jgi:hypothetical protein